MATFRTDSFVFSAVCLRAGREEMNPMGKVERDHGRSLVGRGRGVLFSAWEVSDHCLSLQAWPRF